MTYLKDKLKQDYSLFKSLFTKEELFSFHFLVMLISLLTLPAIFAILFYYYI